MYFERLPLVIGHIPRRVVGGVIPPFLESVQKQHLYQPVRHPVQSFSAVSWSAVPAPSPLRSFFVDTWEWFIPPKKSQLPPIANGGGRQPRIAREGLASGEMLVP